MIIMHHWEKHVKFFMHETSHSETGHMKGRGVCGNHDKDGISTRLVNTILAIFEAPGPGSVSPLLLPELSRLRHRCVLSGEAKGILMLLLPEDFRIEAGLVIQQK